MINSTGPSIEPCRAWDIISDHELYVSFNFIIYCLVNSFMKEVPII